MLVQAVGEEAFLSESVIADQHRIVSESIEALLNHDQSKSIRLNTCYRACEFLCLVGKEPALLSEIKHLALTHFRRALRALFCDTADWLRRLLDLWADLQEIILAIEMIASPLDKGYIINTPERSLRTILLKQLSQLSMDIPAFGAQTIVEFQRIVDLHRSHACPLTEEMQHSLRVLVSFLDRLQLYQGPFETAFLSSSRAFYEAEWTKATSSPATFQVAEYLSYVNRRLDDELTKIGAVLLQDTVHQLKRIVLNAMVRHHRSEILYGLDLRLSPSAGLYQLLASESLVPLQLLNRLLDDPESREAVKKAWQLNIKREGLRLIQSKLHLKILDLNEPLHFEDFDLAKLTPTNLPSSDALTQPGPHRTLIYELIKLNVRLTNIQAAVFDNDPAFESLRKDAFYSFFNMNPQLSNVIAILAARYADELLRSAQASEEGASVEKQFVVHLDRLIAIFKFIQAKDVFKACYEKDVGKRLLYGKCVTLEHEKLAVKKLRSECGPGYTARLESMFRELGTSIALYTRFSTEPKYTEFLKSAPFEFNCRILPSGIWPAPPPEEDQLVAIPHPVQILKKAFADYYALNYKSRNVRWSLSMGTCILQTKYLSQLYELALSQHQAICLLAFNSSSAWSLEALAKHLRFDPSQLRAILSLLSKDPRKKILIETKKGKSTSNEVWTLNPDFSYKSLRVPISNILTREMADEVDQLITNVVEDRTHYIDALLVRLMKRHQTMEHGQLMQEVMTNDRFGSTPALIKSRLETLIDRDYIARDADHFDRYTYVA